MKKIKTKQSFRFALIIMLIVSIMSTLFQPVFAQDNKVDVDLTGVTIPNMNIRPIDTNGDGIVDEYIYYDSDGNITDHIVFPKEQQQAVSIFSALQTDEPLKHVPTDPVPTDYGGNPEDISLAFYPTYGEWVYDLIGEWVYDEISGESLYDTSSATEAALIAYLGKATEVIIPDKIGDYTVVELRGHLFSRSAPYVKDMGYSTGNSHANLVTQVTLPETIRTVGGFLGYTSVESVHLPSSVSYIHDLSYSSALIDISVSSDNQFFTAVDGVLYNKDITQIIAYPPKKTNTTYTLPSTLREVQVTSFANNYFIEAFAVEKENEYFSVNDGVLYNKDVSKLIRYPMNKSEDTYTSPQGVTTIAQSAFDDTKNLKHIILSEGVENMVYVNHFNIIETLTLPSTLVRTAHSEHDDSGINTIYYQMFNLISVTISPNNPVLSSENGIVYNKDKTILYEYPMSKPDTEYIMPDTLLTVNRDSFWYGRYWDGHYLKKVVISASLTDYNESSRAGTWEEFEVADGNEYYTAIDGVLYTKDEKVLVSYPNQKKDIEFVIPESVEYVNTIESYLLETLTVPPNLIIMDRPGYPMTSYSHLTFKLIGKNNYARRWANYFGISFNRIDVTADEISDAVNAASDIIDSLDEAGERLYGEKLETISNIIENFESLSDEEKAKLSPALIAELEEIRDKIAEINHNDTNVSISGATWNTRVDAAEKNPSNPAYNGLQELLNEEDIQVLYDIRLTKSGMNYNLSAGQTMTVTIAGNFTGQTVDTVRIFHLKQDYTTEYITPLTVTDTEITFITTSFSLFAVVSEESNDIDLNGDGKVDIEDARYFLEYLVGNRDLSDLSDKQKSIVSVYNDNSALKNLRKFLNDIMN